MAAPREFWLDTTHTRLTGYTAAGAVYYDNLNGGGLQAEAGCPISEAQEDFVNGVVDGVVEQFADECSATILGGAYRMEPAAGSTTGLCSLTSMYRLDLREGASLRLVQGPPANGDVYFQLEVEAAGGLVRLSIASGVLYADYCPTEPCNTLASRTYVAASDVYLRIREASGSLFFETSADGTSWSELAVLGDSFEVDFASFAILASANGTPTSSAVILDDINILP